jgi:gamma-glutamyl hercynylcysteine S-oxide hydrolase
MCRHLAYLGPPVPLASLVLDPPHSLAHQSWAPRDMRGGGTINADGFGLGWHTAGGVVRYRRNTPIWSDSTLPGLSSSVLSGSILAAVRSATVGMPVVETAAAPFGDGPWLFSHNGVVAGWPSSVAKLAGTLPPTDLLTLDAPTDAALLWVLVRDRLRSGATLAEALAGVVAEVLRFAPGSRLNLLLTDGVALAATAVGHSLSYISDFSFITVASEPLDDRPAWRPVPDGTLLTATATDLTLTSLGEA